MIGKNIQFYRDLREMKGKDLAAKVGCSVGALSHIEKGSRQPSVDMLYYFNSQPHKEADCKTAGSWEHITYFNSQPHQEADNGSTSDLLAADTFQLTASQGG